MISGEETMPEPHVLPQRMQRHGPSGTERDARAILLLFAIAMGVVILVVCAQSVPFVAQAGADTVERWVKGAAALDHPETYRKPPY
ncbi:MAG: hypothetical protein AAB892_00505 [Patescibacteria group bacterium]